MSNPTWRITNSAAGRRPDRATVRAHLREGRADWYKIKATARNADVYIYDEIGYFGVTAQAFAGELAALDVDTIHLRLNSPGGEVFDGIAIYNVLRDHAATVNVTVDGLAASIASVIAMAGDTVTMGHGARMMIHDAQGLALGDAGTMRSLADLLDQESDNIAAFYARKAGGTAEHWRDQMRVNGQAGTWYTAEEAVAAGLADRVGRPEPAAAGVPNNSWDLSLLGLRPSGLQSAQPANKAPTPESEPEPAPDIPVVQLPDPPEPDPVERALTNLNLSDMLSEVVHDQSRNMPAPDPAPAPEPESEDYPGFIIEPVDIINGLHQAGWRTA